MLRTLVAAGTAVADTAFHAPLIMGASYLDPDLAESLSRSWCRVLLDGFGVERRVEGLENLLPGRTAVYVCNHQSHVDPPTCFLSLPGPLRFVAKKSLFQVPVFGWALQRAGHIPIDRSDGAESRERINSHIEALRTKVSVMLFPEGTRSEDGTLGPFKKGAAVLALQAGVPVIPLAIAGTKEVLPKGFNQIRSGVVRLRIGKPISTEGMTLEDRGALTERMRSEVAALMVGL